MIKNTKKKHRNRIIDLWKKIHISFYDWLRKEDVFSGAAIFILTAISISYISLPDSFALNLPASESHIGQRMSFTLRADRDYDIIDEEETRNNRLKAESSVPLHFTYIDNLLYYDKVKNAFSIMRKISNEFFLEEVKKKYKNIPKVFIPVIKEKVKDNLFSKANADIYKSLQKILIENKPLFDKEIGIPSDESAYTLLRRNIFSKDVERSIFTLVKKLDSFYIYRNEPENGYNLGNIIVKKGDALLNIPLNKVISEKTLIHEIKHHQKLLLQHTSFTEKGIALIAGFTYWIVRDNINFNSDLTEKNKMAAWNSVDYVVFSVKNGEIIRRANEKITKRDIKIFKVIVDESSQQSGISLFFQNMLFLMLSIAIIFYTFKKSIKKFSYKNKDLLLMAVQAVMTFGALNLIIAVSMSYSQWLGNIDARIFYFLLPVPFFVAIVRLLVNTETALFFLISLQISFFTVFSENFYFPIFYTLGSLFYLFLITHIDRRSHIIRVSLVLSILLMILTLLIFRMDFTLPWDNIMRAMVFSFLNALGSGLLIISIIPFMEWSLGYTTDITFLEFSTLNHPLMKKMAVHANGTYQHSLTVGFIVEAAAAEIGLSPLACKVMAYFHDLGKVERPEYFSENQTDKNRHDELTPSMSAMVIINHVKKGLELAREHKLGEKIESSILQHQGTSLIKFFYAKAKAADATVTEAMFRYPGPKPQTRENGLIMLADSVEAAVRSMPDKNYQKITDGVDNIINRILEDGQLSECNMTMKDIALIKQSFVKTISGIYHARIEYPDPVA